MSEVTKGKIDPQWLWQERFRPTTIEKMVLTKEMSEVFSKFIGEKANIPHLLFYYPKPGNGKTTIAKALCKNREYEYINASKDNGIDTVRTRVQNFIETRSMNSGFKVVILDETENLTKNTQEALKVMIEEYHEFARFIFITNNDAKILPALKSRLTHINFDFDTPAVRDELVPKFKTRIFSILSYYDISFKEEAVEELIEVCYPDIRSVWTNLQKCYTAHGVIDERVSKRVANDTEAFFKMLRDCDFQEVREYLQEYSEDLTSLYIKVLENFVPTLQQSIQAQVYIRIVKYMAQHNGHISPVHNFIACTLEVMSCIHKNQQTSTPNQS